MKNDMQEVRNMLILGMQKLVDPEKGEKFGVDEAEALAKIGHVLVESAKAEVFFLKVMGNGTIPYSAASGFLPLPNKSTN